MERCKSLGCYLFIVVESAFPELEEENRIIFKYKNNPNGSMNNISGIINDKKNVLGMMPHPERACDLLLGSDDGKMIFQSMIGGNES